MLIDDQDSSEDPNAGVTTRRTLFVSPRFARLVQSPVARRVSPLRLATAIPLGILLVWGLGEAGKRAIDAIARYVAAQPEHQIPFSQIELEPSPPPYIRSGAAGILASVQHEAKYAATISVLDTDLEALGVAMRRNPWIKSVGSVRSSYRRLAIEVVYRQPFAAIVPPLKANEAEVIDLDLVNLPSTAGEIAWDERLPHHRALGQPAYLFEIHGIGGGVADRNGMVWKSASSTPLRCDDLLSQAVQLARFLAERAGSKTPGGRAMPEFPEIHYHREPDERAALKEMGFFLREATGKWVFWQSAPGSEDPIEFKATEKWTQLARYLDAHRGIDLNKDTEFVLFRPDGPTIKRFKPREPPGR